MFYNDLSPIPNTTKAKARINTGRNSGERLQSHMIPQRERREHSASLPVNLAEYLSEDQRLTLRQMDSFGWQLAFIRRPLFQESMAIVTNEDASQYGVLERDGSINMRSTLELRK